MDISVDLDSGGHLAIFGVDDDGTVTNADVELNDVDGQRWSATVLTQHEIGRLMDVWRLSGECQSGAYFRVPDLVIVRDPSRESVTAMFDELHRTGDHRNEMTLLHEE